MNWEGIGSIWVWGVAYGARKIASRELNFSFFSFFLGNCSLYKHHEGMYGHPWFWDIYALRFAMESLVCIHTRVLLW